jgi:hypothetical protein
VRGVSLFRHSEVVAAAAAAVWNSQPARTPFDHGDSGGKLVIFCDAEKK